MTQDRVSEIDKAISDVIGAQIRDLRESAGMSRDDLAAAARDAGAPPTLTGTVIRFLETGRPKDGQRTRFFAFDELLGLAAGLEVSPLELLGDQAVHFAGEQVTTTTSCANCGAVPGPVEQQVRTDLAALSDLEDLEPSLAQIAYGLARAVDSAALEADKALPQLTRELRACLEQIVAGRRARAEPDPDDRDDLDDLGAPDGGGPDLDDLPD